ncbi:MAG: hypothetical protein QOG62_2639 [Thermoleophilaceae bacterium]|nr:hypothetical protein [Thermoleophilaceae bacterium]
MPSIGPLVGKAASGVKRAWPVVLEGYRRWDQLSDKEKERYRQQARDLAEKGRATVKKRTGR